MKNDKKEHNSEPDDCVEAENIGEQVENAEENLPQNEPETDKLKQENAKLKDDYLRAYAELENTKKDALRSWRKTQNMRLLHLPRKCCRLRTTFTVRCLPLPKPAAKSAFS